MHRHYGMLAQEINYYSFIYYGYKITKYFFI